MKRRILIAPNAFKGTLTAWEAGEIIAKTFEKCSSESSFHICPIADGGDGTCELITDYLQLEKITHWTLDPVGRPIQADYGWKADERKAFIDVSAASGLGGLEFSLQNPKNTSTFGTGVLIHEAIKNGCKSIVLGLGGSATIDLGLGILQKLGIIFLDKNGREIPAFSPNFLSRIEHIQVKHPISDIEFECLCDVSNPFFGKEGAIPVFGRQKGLEEDEFESYEMVCEKVIQLLEKKSKKSIKDIGGFGAAGGIAYGLSFFFDVNMKLGAPFFFDSVQIHELIQDADLVITGEGRFDMQSAKGKGPFELKKLCDNYGKDCLLISSGDAGKEAGFSHFLQLPDLDLINPDVKLEAKRSLEHTVELFAKNWA
ncbi:glycerate kinase family protein [Algoriphagus sediminis]|uniref:Glycerate kinase n=1 Tax=Algoriphagus sediminis TaxID=3057113 RepID=A0ABT7YB20_9BACT|nr:glycerate kinase [Algoriphagus sediminis]MDN3203708.1 glycerate kinase [Algoriphagus sediminis]